MNKEDMILNVTSDATSLLLAIIISEINVSKHSERKFTDYARDIAARYLDAIDPYNKNDVKLKVTEILLLAEEISKANS